MKSIFSILFILFPLFSFAEELTKSPKRPLEKTGFLYGVGVSASSEIYKGYDNQTMAIPLIGYKGENLTVFGPFVTYKIKKFNHFEFSLKVAPRFQGFEESDSYIFKGMKTRKKSLDAGVNVSYKNDGWKISVSSMFDTLNRSNGSEIKTSVGKMYRFGPIFIEPSASISFLDGNHVDYYYGVLESEVNQERVAYKGHNAKKTSVALSVATPILLGGYTRMNIEHEWYDSAITDSPLVDTNSNLSFRLFFTKMF